MTFEQAQLYIRIFIFQHYYERVCDVLPMFPNCRNVVNQIEPDGLTGYWWIRGYGYIFTICIIDESWDYTVCNFTHKKIDILDYITLEEESL